MQAQQTENKNRLYPNFSGNTNVMSYVIWPSQGRITNKEKFDNLLIFVLLFI